MPENIAYGWIRVRPKREKVKTTVENILSDYFPPSISELRHNGHQISKCILRDGSFLADFEGQNKSERCHLLLNLSGDYGEVSRLGMHSSEKIVALKEQDNPDFKRYFEFETVSQGRMLVWEVGISYWMHSSQDVDTGQAEGLPHL